MSDGNRIDNRQRGNAHQLHEKYKTLARDAQMQGDRVQAEYYLQFSDHYFRLLAEQRGRQEEARPRQRDNNLRDDEYEGDGEDNERIDLAGLPGPARVLNDRDGDRDHDGGRGSGNDDDGGRSATSRRSDEDFETEDRGDGRRDRQPRREARPRSEAAAPEVSIDRPVDGDDAPAPKARKAPVRRARKAEAADTVDAVDNGAAELFTDADSAVEAPRRRGRPRRNTEATIADV
jgi:hypothetical protein